MISSLSSKSASPSLDHCDILYLDFLLLPLLPTVTFLPNCQSICVLNFQAAYHGPHSPTSSGSYLPPQPHCPSLFPTLSTDHTGLHCSNVPNQFHIKHLHIFSLYVVSSYRTSPKSWVLPVVQVLAVI